MQSRNPNESLSSYDSNNSSITTTVSSPILISKPFKKNLIQNDKAKFVLENQIDPKYKTELCKTFSEKNSCPYGAKCRFAHGKDELFHKAINSKMYKQKNCISFFNNHVCSYGSRCYFKHDERKVEEITQCYYQHVIDNISLVDEDIVLQMNEFELIHFVFKNTPKHIRTFRSKLLL